MTSRRAPAVARSSALASRRTSKAAGRAGPAGGRNVARRKPLPSDLPPNSFPAKLERLLEKKRKGRTDSEIAEAAGLIVQAFTRIRRGQTPDVKISTAEAILNAIGATWTDYDRA